jgi:hypothetical protein
VARPSKPLEGKELEEFMTSKPHVPDGATNTNTTLSLGLLQFTRAHPDVNLLTKRSGCCNQGQCPPITTLPSPLTSRTFRTL